MDSSHTFYKFAIDFFEEAVKIAPVYYITGNHEVWLYGERFDEFLSEVESLGVRFMDGETESFENMIIAGTENGSRTTDYEWEDDSRLKILLAHEPSVYEDYVSTGADIVFAGHVHGGQVIIPGKGGLFSPDIELFPDLYKGEYTFSDMTMYLSAGLGNSVLPLRINNYPEIVVVDIVKEDTSKTIISGEFTVGVRDVIPDYCLDDVTPCVALVTEFQSYPFTIYVGEEIGSQLVKGNQYVFSIEPVEVNYSAEELQKMNLSSLVWEIDGFNITEFRLAKEEELGLESLQLTFKEVGNN